MGIIKRVIGIISQNSHVRHTNIKNIFTKYGLYQAKMYMNNEQEYLAIMSLNFFLIDNPILYIHSDSHQCNPLDEACGCTNEVDVALRTISKEGGLFIYTSKNGSDIDNFLHEIKTQAMESENITMLGTNYKSALKGYRGEYIALDFILKDLKFSTLQLVSDNANVRFIIEQRGIYISRQTSTIAYTYGDSTVDSEQKVIDEAKAISFKYSND